ncbi:MAG: GntR family transcriptional regulator [Clostridiales bacterium]|nr:GntR family transcriptional regulator [Clostridiales bacterium]MDD7259036.1 GntR family transcriptional regulator [Eubacteriales bacterium]
MILKIDTLNQQAYDILKEKILNKELLPGTRLVDSQLAENFGISRTPLRDAIRKLAEEGFVVSTPTKKGYYVYQPSAKDINEIFELRQILDIAAATKVIREILPADPTAFEQLRQVYQAENEMATASFVQHDEDFHDAVIRLCGNARMQAIYTDLRHQTRAFRSVTSRSSQRISKAKSYHEKIYHGFEARDLDATIDAIRKHVEYSREDALADYTQKDS